MEDSWLCIDEDDTSNYSSHSDEINSDIEAELYGVIHHQETLSSENCPEIEKNEKEYIVDSACQKKNDNSYDKKNFKHFLTSHNEIKDSNETCMRNQDNHENYQELSKSRKRKFNSEYPHNSISYGDNFKSNNMSEIKTTSLSNNLKKIHECTDGNVSPQKKFKSDTDSSNSDDSIIWIEPDTSDLKTKLDSIVCLSDNSDDLNISSVKEKESPQNKSFSYLTEKTNFEDLWHINDDDLYRRKKNSQRFYNSEQCSYCNKKGHTAKSCPVPKVVKCFICGGEHLGSICKNKICFKCYKMGHGPWHCWKISSFYCSHCNMKGHHQKNCPDIWRRYHLTTKSKKIVKDKPVKQNRPVYCFNCGWPGHFGAICREPRNSRILFPTWPLVLSYDNPIVTKLESCQEREMPSNRRKTVDVKEQLSPQQSLNSGKQSTQNPDALAVGNCRKTRKEIRKRKHKKNAQLAQENTNNKKQLYKIQERSNFKGSDFPRTPKSNQSIDSRNDLPVVRNFVQEAIAVTNVEENKFTEDPHAVQLALKKKLQKKKKNMKRRMKRIEKFRRYSGLQRELSSFGRDTRAVITGINVKAED